MSAARDAILARIKAERERQLDLPGAEWDLRNTPNDWIAIASTYLCRESQRNYGVSFDKAEYIDSLIKAAAVILAALEHSSHGD